MERALAAPRDGDLFPFWASLALELLARAALAKTSPVLLADASDADGRHLLHALGLEPKVKTYVPKSITASDVLTRCEQIVPAFTKDIESFCRGFTNKRNEELHSGGSPFLEVPTQSWLPRYFEASKVLLAFQGLKLDDFVGAEEAKAAEVMLQAVADEAAKNVQKQISAYAEVWKSKKADEQEQQSKQAEKQAQPWRGHVVRCPACGSPALLTGEEVKQQPPVLEGEEIVVRSVLLPTKFECTACGLEIDGHSLLHAAGLGGQFTRRTVYDPVDYYASEDYSSDGGYEFNNE